jgi:DMSO/TMAO reductase YedYZ heme-binding membrane subunit
MFLIANISILLISPLILTTYRYNKKNLKNNFKKLSYCKYCLNSSFRVLP